VTSVSASWLLPCCLITTPLVVELLDGGDEQRRLLELLVLVGESLEFLLVLVVLGVGVEEPVSHLLVVVFEVREPLLECLDLLLL